MAAEPVVIVMAEDDDGHATLVKRNLKRAGVVNEIIHLKDGQETLDFLHCRGAYRNRTLTGSIVLVLDINMPRMDGIEVLRQLKADPKTERIPVIMLTTTDDPREVEQCYQLGCNVYITKPVSHEAFTEAIQRFGMFLQVVEVPSIEESSGDTP